MKYSKQLLLLFLVLISLVFFANVQSGIVSENPAIVDNIDQGTNDTGSQPVRATGAGFSVAAQSNELRKFPIEPVEPQFKEAMVPGIVKPYTVTRDRAGELPLSIAAPPLQKNFDGVKFHGLYPSDTTIASGPTEIFVAVNSSYAIYTKTGAKRAERTFDDWFSVISETRDAFFFDPKLAYDQYSGHFILIVDAIRESDKRAWYILAVSQTSNPEGFWTFWALDQNLNGTVRTKNWVDYPSIGLDERSIYLTGNVFNFTPGKFLYAKLRILNKAEVYQFGTIHFRDFWNLRDATGQLAFTVQPAHSYGTTTAESMLSTNRLQASSLTLWKVANSTGSPAITKKKVAITAFKIPPDAGQKGGGSFIATNDSRLSDAVLVNGSIYAAHSVSHNWGGGEVSALRYYQVRVSDGVVLQDGTFGADNSNYFFPAIATDLRGNSVIVFVRSNSAEFVSIRFTGHKTTDQISILQNSSQLKGGIHNYFLAPDQGVERWGDYSGVSLDPDNSIWMYAMYAAAPVDVWKSRVGKTRFP